MNLIAPTTTAARTPPATRFEPITTWDALQPPSSLVRRDATPAA